MKLSTLVVLTKLINFYWLCVKLPIDCMNSKKNRLVKRIV